MRGYDAWLTREPDRPEPPLPGDPGWPRCGGCGAWLRLEPDSVGYGEETRECSGRRPRFLDRYDADRDAGVLAIIGEEHAGEEFVVEYDCACGRDDDHEPHAFVVWAWDELHRTCRACGRDDVQVEA